ncbi:MAG: hypothetical protein U0175_22100 [Caldilineaceae bacterium]
MAVTIWPVGSATDPWMYLAFAILDRDHGKLNDFISQYGMTDMEALVNAESNRQGVRREYLSMLGSGALWYWQETSSGHHLTGIYAVNGEQRIAMQALVSPEHTAEEMQAILISKVAKLLESDKPVTASSLVAPVYVDRCPNFTAYDAAAILQEPVNENGAVGNILFGPLQNKDMSEGLTGFCGFTNRQPPSPTANPEQTHVLTDLNSGHAVVAAHLTGEILYSTNGTYQSDWWDMIALAEVLAAANPKDDGSTFDYLYGTFNIGDFASWTHVLYTHASTSPSFKVRKLELSKDDPRDELLWFWQTLDEGYFSLLVSHQGGEFDIVAARLGSGVAEKTVLAYSQVVLGKLADPEMSATASSVGCDTVSLDLAGEIVGDDLTAQPVVNAQGTGCKYIPRSDKTKIQPDDFSSLFTTFGLLAGSVPPKAAHQLISGMVQELSTNGSVTDGDALSALLDAVKEQDFVTALQTFGSLEWNSGRWQVETVSDVSDETVLISGKSGNGWYQFFLLSPNQTGGVNYLTGVLHDEVDKVRSQIIEAALALNQGPTASVSASKPVINGSNACPLLSLQQAESMLGESLFQQRASGERGEGCKFLPVSERSEEADNDFAPEFITVGVLAGIMTQEGAQTTLQELHYEINSTDRRLDFAIQRGDISTALTRLALLKPSTEQWTVEPIAEVSTSAIWVHGELDGYLLSIFMHSKSKNETRAVIVKSPLESDTQALRDAVVAILQDAK